MERSTLDQAIELLTRGQRLLLAVPPDTSADALCAMVGLSLALAPLGKETTMISPSFVPEHLQFLPGTSGVRERLEPLRELRLEIPLDDLRIRDLQWHVADSALSIAVQSEGNQAFPDREVRVQRRQYPWDTMVTLGTTRLHALGPTFTDHTAFFYDTPLLNIDRGTANEFFGTVNLVPATASTNAEVVLELLETLGGVSLLSREVATCLLTGVMAGSRSFRSPTITPRTFQAASKLLEQEADHQMIVRHLFKTHTSAELRLLGRTLARLEELPDDRLWTLITQRDLVTLDADPDAMPGVLRDLLEWTGASRVVLLGFERRPGTLEVLVAPGRLNAEDRDALRDRLAGVLVGPFVLVNLGSVAPKDARQAVAERILPRLPREERQASA